jgi:hypothetical protein
VTRPAPKASDLELATNSHRYRDPRDGKLLVSVTSVVGNYDSGDKLGAGAGAAVRLTKMGVDYRADWNARKETGNRVHKHIWDWALGKTVEVTEADDPYLDAFAGFCQAKAPLWLQTERAVVSSHGAGGRFDLLGVWEGDTWLIDAKTGKVYERELELQLGGYAGCDGMVIYDATGTAVALEPLPQIDRWGGLYLSDKGVATLVEVPKLLLGEESRAEAQAKAIDAFRSLLAVRLWAMSRPK